MSLLGKLRSLFTRSTAEPDTPAPSKAIGVRPDSSLLSAKWEAKFWSNINKSGECWLWKGAVSQRGCYGVFTVTGETQFRRFLAHRLAWQLIRGPLRRTEILFHLCDEDRCVRPDHFSIGTPEQRMDRMMAKRVRGGSSPGEKNSQAKLTEEQVLEIRRRYSVGDTSYRTLAKEFGLSSSGVGLIVRRLNWGWLPEADDPSNTEPAQ